MKKMKINLIKNQVRFIITAFAVLFTFSCNDLDEELFSEFTSDTFLVNEQQLATQALGMAQVHEHVFWGIVMWPLTVEPSKYYNGKNGVGSAVYRRSPSDNFTRIMFNNLAIGIARANSIIKNVPLQAKALDQEIIDQHVAEARYFRAWSYFLMVRLWGGMPIYEGPIEEFNLDLFYPERNTVEEVYDFIEQDLIFASQNLPINGWSNSKSGRVLRAGAIHLLGKFYLTKAGYPIQDASAYQKAIDVLKPLVDDPSSFNTGLMPTVSDVFKIANEGNKEILYAWANTRESGFGSLMAHQSNPDRNIGLSPTARRGTGNWTFSQRLLDLYEPDDTRYTLGFHWSFQSFPTGETVTYDPDMRTGPRGYGGDRGISISKYVDPEATRNVASTNDVIHERLGDTYLLIAEAYNENDDQPNALNYLNIIRQRSGASDITETDQTLLRQIIREERARELHGEWHDIHDIRRWDAGQENMEEHRTIERGFHADTWQDYFKLWPVPEAETSLNQNFEQNPGW